MPALPRGAARPILADAPANGHKSKDRQGCDEDTEHDSERHI